MSTDSYLSRPKSGWITLSHITKIWRARPATLHRQRPFILKVMRWVQFNSESIPSVPIISSSNNRLLASQNDKECKILTLRRPATPHRYETLLIENCATWFSMWWCEFGAECFPSIPIVNYCNKSRPWPNLTKNGGRARCGMTTIDLQSFVHVSGPQEYAIKQSKLLSCRSEMNRMHKTEVKIQTSWSRRLLLGKLPNSCSIFGTLIILQPKFGIPRRRGYDMTSMLPSGVSLSSN